MSQPKETQRYGDWRDTFIPALDNINFDDFKDQPEIEELKPKYIYEWRNIDPSTTRLFQELEASGFWRFEDMLFTKDANRLDFSSKVRVLQEFILNTKLYQRSKSGDLEPRPGEFTTIVVPNFRTVDGLETFNFTMFIAINSRVNQTDYRRFMTYVVRRTNQYFENKNLPKLPDYPFPITC